MRFTLNQSRPQIRRHLFLPHLLSETRGSLFPYQPVQHNWDIDPIRVLAFKQNLNNKPSGQSISSQPTHAYGLGECGKGPHAVKQIYFKILHLFPAPFKRGNNTSWHSKNCCFFLSPNIPFCFFILGRQDPNPMDCTRSHCLWQVHLSQRCLELWDSDVGSHVLWRETLLGDDQSRCKRFVKAATRQDCFLIRKTELAWGFQSEKDSCWKTPSEVILLSLWNSYCSMLFYVAAQNRFCTKGNMSVQSSPAPLADCCSSPKAARTRAHLHYILGQRSIQGYILMNDIISATLTNSCSPVKLKLRETSPSVSACLLEWKGGILVEQFGPTDLGCNPGLANNLKEIASPSTLFDCLKMYKH